MDSLLANYASSDEDEEEQQHHPPSSITTNNTRSHKTTPSSSLSLFSSLPPPKSQSFSSPLPQTHSSSYFPNPPDPTPKRVVVQFKHPPKPSHSDSDSEDEPPKNPKRPSVSSAGDSSSVRSFLSSIPAPKNSSSSSTTLGGGIAGSSRRSTIEYEATPSDVGQVDDSSSGGFQQPHCVDYSSSYGDGIGFDYHGQIASGSDAAVPVPVPVPVPIPGKRGRKDVATEIVEVKQDDLTKDRPREDQVKLTGIAFGPSYHPVSAKGKPSKLHKRKHQIGSLFFDMKQKEMELAERRAKGFLTKAQTQGKYGW